MIEIVSTSQFRKAFKRKIRGNKKLEARFRERVALFQNDPFESPTQDTSIVGRFTRTLEFQRRLRLSGYFFIRRSDSGIAY
jgi:mRNA-degrading endonuclease YafQ of YafQ-DinJ toxin-antitoxin module